MLDSGYLFNPKCPVMLIFVARGVGVDCAGIHSLPVRRSLDQILGKNRNPAPKTSQSFKLMA